MVGSITPHDLQPWPLPRIGGYEVVAKLGEGGMGEARRAIVVATRLCRDDGRAGPRQG